MPTTNPVPSQDPSDLLFNAGKLDEVVSSSNATYTDRLGVSRRTMAGVDAAADVVLGGLGYAPPVAYAAGIALTLTTQTVEYSGEVYAPKGSVLPFTTSGTFETEKFRLIQGVASADLASGGGATMVGYTPAGTGAVATTAQSKLRESVSVKDFGAVGDGVADDTGAIHAAITYALSQYSRSANSVFGYFPTKKVEVVFPTGIYNVSSALTPNNGGYAVCDLVGEGAATIRFIGIGACIYSNPVDPGLALMSSPVHIKNLHIRKDNKAAGSVGLVVERMTNCLFENVNFYGFEYAIQVLGAIDCEFDFKGAMIQHCDIGILIQQKSGSWGIMKPNLTTIRNAYFVDCANNAIVIRRNPDESLTNNGAGGVISIIDCNFQNNSSGPTVLIQSPGEVPGKGTVNIIRCWFEGHGNTALALIDGKATMENCFIMNGLNPIMLYDTTSKLVLDELGCFFSVSPTGTAVIKRDDGTTAGLSRQVNARNTVITVDGIGGVWLGAQNKIPNNNLNLDSLQTGLAFTSSGTVSLAGSGGFSDIMDLSDGGTYIFSVQQADGGIAWSGQFVVVSSGASLIVTTLRNLNVTLTGSGASARLTNTNPDAIDLQWAVIRIA